MESQPNPSRVCRWRWIASALIRCAIVACAATVVGGMWVRTEPLRQFGGRELSGEDRFSQVARIYAPLRGQLWALHRVGFVCGKQTGDEAELHYYMAQSMLAPTLVVRTTDAPTVIAVFDSDADLAEFVSRGGFRERQRVADGVAILERGRR